MAARKFNQGFATVEYPSSALVDIDAAPRPSAETVDVGGVRAAGAGSDRHAARDRHAPPHAAFRARLFGRGYSAAYYSYLWSEVLDADAFKAFEETGDMFDPQTAARLKQFIYSAGNLRDPAEAYTAFRGKLPTPDALLVKRGLLAPVTE